MKLAVPMNYFQTVWWSLGLLYLSFPIQSPNWSNKYCLNQYPNYNAHVIDYLNNICLVSMNSLM